MIYAKAHPRARPPAASAPVVAAQGTSAGDALARSAPAAWTGALDDARAELVARGLVPPIALLVAWLLVSSGPGHALVRTFLTMWLHELGHAITAWLCGFGAFPGPWRTPVSSGRMPLVTIVLAAAFAALVLRGRRDGRRLLVAGGVAGLVAQAIGLALPPRAAQALVTFGGDAGCLVLGALGMATFYAPPESRLRTGALRWGFVGIGAAGLVDTLDTWLRARVHPAAVPLGEIEGVGLSDASKLVDVHGWSIADLTARYVALGLACLAAVAAVYATGLVRARAEVAACARREQA